MGCKITSPSESNNFHLVPYTNNDNLSIKRDREVIHDINFNLQVPSGLKGSNVKVDDAFTHILHFNDEAKIVLFYFPDRRNKEGKQLNNLSYKNFMEVCKEEDILKELKGIEILKDRHFGLNKEEGISLFTLYLNVKSKSIEAFNQSIGSVKF